MVVQFDAEVRRQEDASRRRLAYCGWLVTNDTFREEITIVREYGKVVVAAEGGFPSILRSVLGKSSGPTDENHLPFHTFYRRWGLERLITWDLPCPLEPGLSGAVTHARATLSEAGLSVFIPWFLLKNKNSQLDELVAQLGIYRNPVHLRGWLEPSTGGKRTLGYTRFANLMKLFRFWRLRAISSQA